MSLAHLTSWWISVTFIAFLLVIVFAVVVSVARVVGVLIHIFIFSVIRLYVNGLEINLSGNPLNVNSNNDPIRIASDFGGRFFQGRIDEVRIWNISRSEIEINSNMEGSLSGNEDGWRRIPEFLFNFYFVLSLKSRKEILIKLFIY